MGRKLYLSDTNKKIGGVCGGIGEYFNVDPTIIRLAWVILIFVWGAGLLGYFIAWAIIPRRSGF
jgi:phage shock protein C